MKAWPWPTAGLCLANYYVSYQSLRCCLRTFIQMFSNPTTTVGRKSDSASSNIILDRQLHMLVTSSARYVTI